MEISEENAAVRLAEAVSRLDKSQHIKPATKTTVSSGGRNVDVRKLTELLTGSGEHAEVGKKIRGVHRHKAALQKPLERREADKIQRSTGFEEIKAKLDRWNSIVAKNRTAEQRKFPLPDPEDLKKRPADEYVSKYSVVSELEKELNSLAPSTEETEQKHFPLTMAEMIEHRKEMARLRAKQSYKEAKARRQGKIKSKKYHRIQRKEKVKAQLKEFEVLQKSNPEEALRKLEQLEKTRAEERVTLRHKSTGQWAKNKLVRAKYDKETRQQLAQQLAISRELTQKINIDNGLESDDETEEIDENPMDAISNPWMQTTSSSEYADFKSGYKKFWEEHNKKLIPESGDEDEDQDKNSETNEIITNVENEVVKNISNGREPSKTLQDNQINKTEDEKTVIKLKKSKKQKNKKLKNKSVVATSEWNVEPLSVDNMFDELDTKLSNKVSQKINKIKQSLKKKNVSRSPKKSKDKNNGDELMDLSFKPTKIRPVIDEELIEESGKNKMDTQENVLHNSKISASDIINENKLGKNSIPNEIDPNLFIAPKPKQLKTTLPDAELGEDHLDDNDEDDGMGNAQMTIAEAFEDDDIIANFQEEKQDDVDKNKPQIDDSFLPGWGSWTGKNLAVPKRKRKRFFTNTEQKIPRKDDKKDNLIIREKKSDELKSHLVSDLPFPFTSVKDFESTLRQPVGNTFIPETAHKKLTRPSTIVKTGVIIKPMSEDQLIDPKKKKVRFESTNKIFL